MQLTVHDVVKDFGGSISAEHGIGTMKRDLLPRYKSQRGAGRHARLKQAFDPKNILNPGKTVPPVRGFSSSRLGERIARRRQGRFAAASGSTGR